MCSPSPTTRFVECLRDTAVSASDELAEVYNNFYGKGTVLNGRVSVLIPSTDRRPRFFEQPDQSHACEKSANVSKPRDAAAGIVDFADGPKPVKKLQREPINQEIWSRNRHAPNKYEPKESVNIGSWELNEKCTPVGPRGPLVRRSVARGRLYRDADPGIGR